MDSFRSPSLRRRDDFLEIKRGDKLGCSICGGNEWKYIGGVGAIGRMDDGSYHVNKLLEMVAIQCQNCFQVITFNRKVLNEFG